MNKEVFKQSKVVYEIEGEDNTTIQLRHYNSLETSTYGEYFLVRANKEKRLYSDLRMRSYREIHRVTDSLIDFLKGDDKSKSKPGEPREELVIDNKDVTIKFLGLDENICNYDAWFEIKNKTKKYIDVRADEVSMNEFYLSGGRLTDNLPPGKTMLGRLFLDKKVLKRARLKSIIDMTDFEFTLTYSKWTKTNTEDSYKHLPLIKASLAPFVYHIG